MTATEMKEYYRPDELAELIKVSRRTIYEWIRTGKLHSVKIAGCRRITNHDLAELMQTTNSEVKLNQ